MRCYRCSVLLVLSFASASAQIANPGPHTPSIRATGEGTVQVKPDQAKIDIGVVTQADTAQTAAAQNAAQLQSALTHLKAAAGNAEIKTTGYSLNPVYNFPRNGKQTIQGYRAVNTVEVTTEDLSAVGKIVDAATQGGANEIQSLQFTLKDPAPARAQALRKAVLEARANAQAMAAAMGLKLGHLISLEQSGGEPFRPMMAMAAAERVAVPTPIQPDTIEVRANVTLTMAVE